MLTTHTNTESKRKVISVFPPERKVKYVAFINEYDGKKREAIKRKTVARFLTSSVVLYNFGKNGEKQASISPTPTQVNVENIISLVAVDFASLNFLAPKSCPTIIEIALPRAINTTLNRPDSVEEMLKAATVVSPLRE